MQTKETASIKTPPSKPPGMSSERMIILAALVAMALKIYCASTTIGTNDTKSHFEFGRIICKYGLDYMYRLTDVFNHTPVTGGIICLAYSLANKLDPYGSPHAYQYFPLILRLPGIFADFLTVLVLLLLHKKTGRPPVWALALFALSPVSFMVSGYHGNVDSVMVLFLAAAAYCCVEKHPAMSGLFLGLSCNIKVIPLLLTPVFFFFWLHRGKKAAWQFTAACVFTCVAGWSVALIGSPAIFLKNVLGYNHYWGQWGITYWLNISPWEMFHPSGPFTLTSISQAVLTILKDTVILGVLVIGWTQRRLPNQEFFSVLAGAWLLFFVLSPNIAPQYMIWLAPFVLFYSPGWYAVLTAASGLFLFFFYNTISQGMPWFYGESKVSLNNLWLPWSNCPWAVLIAMLAVWLKTKPSYARQSP
jgi:Glycosyltransferase family 87